MLRSFIKDFIGLRPAFPRARLVDIGDHSAVFETTTDVEDYRARDLGGERELVREYIDHLEAGLRVWDVGANIGVYSLFAARAGARVHAFEPDPAFLERLRRNVYLNGQQEPIQVHETALNDSAGEVTLYTDGVAGNSPALSADADGARDEVTVTQQRGDTLDLPAPDLVKIDVEGAEAGVLRGMTDVLDRIGTVLVEVHPTMLPRFGDTPADVRDVLESRDFSVVYERRRDEQLQLVYSRE